MSNLEFYFAPGTSSMAAHIALHEAGATFAARPLSFATNERREASFRAINPEGKVPVLVIDGRPLTEVAAILFYLARVFPEAALLPKDIEAEAQVISWMSFIAATVHPARRKGLDHAKGIYRIADERLGAHGWAVGSYSIADIHLFRHYWRFFNSLAPERGTFPNLDRHYARMMARPAVQKTIQIESALGYHLPA
jgi:glutathione S-transferase